MNKKYKTFRKIKKYIRINKHTRAKKQIRGNKQNTGNKQNRSKNNTKVKNNSKNIKNIKLIIKDLGKKTKKYRRIQYGCKKQKGGGPEFQPMTYLAREAEQIADNTYNTMYGFNREEVENY